jgi:excisionase family DNA binding protein
METYLTIREVGDLLRVSERTVRRWVGTGDLPAVKIGRSVRIRREDIDSRSPQPSVQPSSAREEQLAVLARARDLRQKMAAPGAENSLEILRQIRLERAGGPT